MTQEAEIVWVADFGLEGHYDHRAQPPKIGTTTVVKRTAKRVTVQHNQFTGYLTCLSPEDCYATREALVAAIADRCEQLAKYHEELAAKFREAVK